MVENKCGCSCTSSNIARAVIGWNVSRDWLRHSGNDGDLSLWLIFTEQMYRLLGQVNILKYFNSKTADGEVILSVSLIMQATHTHTHKSDVEKGYCTSVQHTNRQA